MTTSGTFAADIEGEAGGEPILAAVIGEMGWSDYNEDGRTVPPDKKGVVLSWDEARPWLNYTYDRGYGAPECHAVAVYTETRVIGVSQYDGATNLYSVPRNPVPHMPEMPGG